MKTLVIGFGNPIYGDDGFGSCMARYLMQYNDFVMDGNAHGIGILGNLMGIDNVIFIDVDSDLKPGEVALERIEGSLTVSETRLIDAHRMPPSVLVGYLRAMGYSVNAWLIGVGPGNMEPFKPPSKAVITAIPTVLELLRDKLRELGVELRLGGDPVGFIINCFNEALGIKT